MPRESQRLVLSSLSLHLRFEGMTKLVMVHHWPGTTASEDRTHPVVSQFPLIPAVPTIHWPPDGQDRCLGEQ